MYSKIRILVLSCLFAISLAPFPAYAELNAPVYTCLKAMFQVVFGWNLIKSAVINENNGDTKFVITTDNQETTTTFVINLKTSRVLKVIIGSYLAKCGAENACLVLNN